MSAETTVVPPRLDTLQVVELAEGVEIRLPTAGPLARAKAYAIDAFIRIALCIAAWLGLMSAGILVGHNLTSGLALLIWFLVEWIYPVFFEASRWRATPGKRMTGLAVVQTNGSPVTFGQAVIRNFLRAADGMPGFTYLIGIVCCLSSRRFQRLGDVVAGTVVVYAAGRDIGPRMAAPPPLATRAITVALSPEEKSAVVSFRERAGFWTSGRQVELADNLAILTERTGPEGVQRLMEIAGRLQDGKGGRS